jgi:hypothetical protein
MTMDDKIKTIEQWFIYNNRLQKCGGPFESREKAQAALERKFTSAAARSQFFVQKDN